jgi:hypothetical protein
MKTATVRPGTSATRPPSTSRAWWSRGRAASRASALAVVVAALAPSACDSDKPSRTHAVFELRLLGERSREGDLYAIPFPNDLRRRRDGSVDLGPLATGQPPLVQRYLELAARVETGGFALNGAAYFRFSGALDPACLPATPADSQRPSSSVQWVNVDERSASFGERVPVRVRYSAEKGLYIGEHSVAVLPVPGFTLEPSTRYAVLVTEALCDVKGDSVGAAGDFEKLIARQRPDRPELVDPHASYAPLRAFLERESLTGVISATLLTTGDPARLVARARAVLYRSPAPQAEEVKVVRETSRYFELAGKYQAPNFQDGTPPYLSPEDGGAIKLDAAGDPRPARTETMRFALTVPRGEMPAAGWPLVIYAHGTGGDYRTFIGEGLASTLAEVKDPDGKTLARLAMIGIDQNLHGTRAPAGSSPELTFFNFQNPAASVHNVVQSGIDDFSLLRMVKGLALGGTAIARGSGKRGAPAFVPPIRFDASRIYFMGHSQGGVTGPAFLAHEPEVKAAVLSGAGGGAALSLLEKTEPVAIKGLLDAALKEPADEFHPIVNLLQLMLDQADTINFGRMLVANRAKGVGPKHVFLSQGLVDHYTPNSTTDALATAIGVQLVGPELRAVEGLALRKLSPRATPVAGNLQQEGIAVTGALLQYRAVPMSGGKSCSQKSDCGGGYCDEGRCREDGHFVIFDDATARRQYSLFLASAARDGVPSIFP